MEQAVQTEVVLRTLFQCVSFEKLGELRLVCKYWNRLASDELRKRSDLIDLDHANDPKKVKAFYNLELSMKNQDITAKIPISAYIQRNDKNDWKFLKDIATREGWRTRVSVLELKGFWASDLNRLLPFLLDQLPSVTALALLNINMYLDVKSIIPRDFNIPEVSPTKRFPLTSFRATFFPVGTADDASGTLDPRFLRQCHSLKEFDVLIGSASKETIGFFELLNGIYSEGVDFLGSCDKISLLFRSNAFDEKGPLATLAQFVNSVQPASLHLDLNPCDKLNQVYFLNLLQVEPRAFSANFPSPDDNLCFSNWLMKTLKKFKIFSQLEELCLKPMLGLCWKSHEVPEEVARDVKHNLDKVTTLRILLDPDTRVLECEKFKCLLEDAAHHLRNVTRLELVELHYTTNRAPTILTPRFNFTTLFEGIRQFRALREILCNVEDLTGELQTAGVEIDMIGCCGMLEPLSLLAGSTVQTLTLNVRVAYDLSLEMVLLALFKGYEPKVQLNLNLKTMGCELKKYCYSKEELKETLAKICKRSP